MDVLQQFDRYVQENKLFTKEEKILVAVSAGRDSMFLLWALWQGGYNIVIAHCNFKLRGEESNADQLLVEQFAKDHKIPIEVISFDTEAYAATHRMSIQIAARQLRYDWFDSLRLKLGCSVIAVAHHQNDSVETVLFNLARGTGLTGLQGILPKREDSAVVRPLLFLNRKQITALVGQYQIPFRDDASNFSIKYSRNKIRLDIVPQFEHLNPDFITIMMDNTERFRDAIDVLNRYSFKLRENCLVPRDKYSFSIAKEHLKGLTINELYYMLESYGFSKPILEDLLHSLDKESGKVFESAHYILLTDRESILLTKKVETPSNLHLYPDTSRLEWGRYVFESTVCEDKTIIRDASVAMLDFDKLIFPLTMRSWQEGDTFHPLGMQGRKKLSDFFIQKKISVLDKPQVPVLVNGDGRIIWVATFQMDDRFKIEDNTQKVFKLVCNLREQ